jgi:phosphoribulokinase
MAQHLRHVRAGEPILKPVYRHADGTFGPPQYVEPHAFAVVEGLLGYHTDELCDVYDVRVYLAPPEDLRRRWKVDRDCTRRGYTTDEVLSELDRREPDSAAFIRPQQRQADMVVSFRLSEDADGALDAELILCPGLPHPDLSPIVEPGSGIVIEERGANRHLWIPGGLEPGEAAAIEEAVWDKMHFASHLRTERLGEYTVRTELHRSETLALAQLLILYHLATAKAAVALGSEGSRHLTGQPGAARAVAR